MDTKDCARLMGILKTLKSSNSSWPFLAPVDWKGMGLDDYPIVISEPMDLKTIAKKIKLKAYKNASQFWRDVNLIWSNCRTFNSESAEVYQLAKEMEKLTNSLKAADEAEVSNQNGPRVAEETEPILSAQDNNPTPINASLSGTAGGSTNSDESSNIVSTRQSHQTAPKPIIMFCERFGLLDPVLAATVIKFVAQQAPSCLKLRQTSSSPARSSSSSLFSSPQTQQQSQQQQSFDLDVGTLYSEHLLTFRRAHGLIKLLLSSSAIDTA